MADDTINPNNGSQYWNNYIFSNMPSAKANALQSGTTSLNSMGSPNLESSAGTGFAASSQGVTGGGFGATSAAGSVPATAASQNATGAAVQNLENPTTGNTASSFNNSSASMAMNPVGSATSGVPGTGQAAGSSGLSSGLFQQAASKASSGLFNGLTDNINQFGQSLGFGASASQQGAADSAELADEFGSSSALEGSEDAELADEFGADSPSTFGIDPSAGSLTGSTLSSVFGDAGIGAFEGNLLSHLTGESPVGSEIGGALGGIAGGALLGSEIGSIIPGLGTIIGAGAGALIGGLFGNSSTPTNATGAGATLNPDGSLTSVGEESKNPNSTSLSFVDSAMSGFNTLATGAASTLGIKFNSDVQFNAMYSSKHGGANIVVSDTANGTSTGALSFDPSDSASTSSAYLQAITTAASYSGYTDTQAISDWYYGQGAYAPAPIPNSSSITIAPRMS